MPISDLFQIRIYHGYILQIFLAELLFFPLLERRDHFVIRLILSFIGFSFLSLLGTNIVYIWFPSGFNSFIIFFLSLVMGFAVFKRPFKEVLYCFVGAQLVQNLAHNIENLIYLPSSENINDVGWFFISVSCMVVIYTIAYFVIVRRFHGRKISLQGYGVLSLALFSLLFCYLIQYLLQIYQISDMWVTCLPLILCDVLALILQFGVQGYKWMVDENAELERFIQWDSKYYLSLQENMDIINMKAHDLKHYITDLKDGKYMDEESLSEIQDAVERYEESFNTGNKALDSVLTEKMYSCSKMGIPLSVIADGSDLYFMQRGDVISIFGNLLSNAIEHEQTIQEKEKRYILLKVFKKENLLCIHCENYCVAPPQFEGDLPKTTKGDSLYHGYGLKSVRYTVKKYGGNILCSVSSRTFSVDIILPRQTDEK